ncbi:hypothetical protein N7532_005682 [Penicillium argentinense]|uniref:RRM domain-containing protein n=1 Tax=Penicillium argentinense TaxID=1131581 RepID=A0A9W9FEJ6_9EURO|nr:uncharacterized protein N7532_005682 [Penicillium argentinense]KAJ5098681.1 hypothetical protein N7532_005682 [Penicillium argentinense]
MPPERRDDEGRPPHHPHRARGRTEDKDKMAERWLHQQLDPYFAPRPIIKYLGPVGTNPERQVGVHSNISATAQFLAQVREDIANGNEIPFNLVETTDERNKRLRREKKEANEQKLKEGIENYDPRNDPEVRSDPYRTLFVSRISYEANERDLEEVFSRFGRIERIRLVKSTKENAKKPHQGYAFLEFETEQQMKEAYKVADQWKIKGRPVKVDVQRGLTTRGWLPQRLGGGLGGRGYTQEQNTRMGFNAPSGPGGYGGFRGGGYRGFRGGGRGDRGGRGGSDRYAPRGGVGHGRYGGQPPPNAPSGPGGGRGGGGRVDRITGSNREPVRPRDSYADRDRDRGDRDGDRYRDRDHMSDLNGDRYRDRDRERNRYDGREEYGRPKRRYRDDDDRHDPRTKRRYD